jgi:ribulose-5-phosphate 4-epimerase/fuculose-1-phosphate aldolase
MTEDQPPEVVAGDFTATNATGYTGGEWDARVELAAMYRLAAHFGYDDTVWNHLTMRVPGSDHDFFLNKFGLLYDEVTASNIIKINNEGTVLEGPANVNSAGFVIHSAIHNDFPKWKVVFHAHVPDALAVTALKDGFQHIVQDTSMLYGEIGYHDWEGLSLTLEERERLAANMEGNRALLKAHATGQDFDPGPQEIWDLSKRQYDHFPLGINEWPALMRMLDRKDPGYRQ